MRPLSRSVSFGEGFEVVKAIRQAGWQRRTKRVVGTTSKPKSMHPACGLQLDAGRTVSLEGETEEGEKPHSAFTFRPPFSGRIAQ